MLISIDAEKAFDKIQWRLNFKNSMIINNYIFNKNYYIYLAQNIILWGNIDIVTTKISKKSGMSTISIIT